MRIRACLLILPLVSFACGGDDDPLPESGCPVPDLCDITQTACQVGVLNLTACVRGDKPPSIPDVRVIKLDEFRDELDMMNADAEPNGAEDKALAALHLLPDGGSVKDSLIDAQADSVVAYYDDELKRVTIINAPRLTSSDALSSMYELSHELTHYLQDQSPGIAATMEHFDNSVDGIQAGRSLIEGEAVVTSTRALAVQAGRDLRELAWSNITMGLSDSVLDDMRKSDAPFAVAAVELPYVLGTPYIADVWNRFGRARVGGLFDEAPRRAVDWLAGYGDNGPRPSLSESLDCGPPLAPEGFDVVELDSFGITGATALLSAAGDTSELDHVKALSADALAVYSKGEGAELEALAAWRLRFESSADLDAFVDAFRRLDLEWRSFDNELVIIAGDDAKARFDDAALEACPALDDVRAAVKEPHVMASLLRRPPPLASGPAASR